MSPAAEDHSFRLFVLVEAGETRGVFMTWEAAEGFADDQDLSISRIYEFKTRPSHPEHLHLMSALWDEEWRFVGEWPEETPPWRRPPRKIRLDHYHVSTGEVKRLRQEDWNWHDHLLARIDPMAPDAAPRSNDNGPDKAPSEMEWKPRLPPLRAVTSESSPQAEETLTSAEVKAEPSQTAGEPAPAEPKPEAPPEKAAKSNDKTVLQSREEKRKPSGPTPIPHFEPLTAVASSKVRKPALKADPMEKKNPVPGAVNEPKTESPQAYGKVKRIWPLKLILPMAAILLIWGWGIYNEVKPPSKTQKVVARSTTLTNSRKIPVEPGYLFFQMDVDPAHQQRWARTLGLDPIPRGDSYGLPHFHSLETWPEPEGYFRAPYSEAEVREWWNLRMNEVSFGFYHQWPDGSLIILDLKNDRLIGGGEAEQLTTILN